MLTRRFGLPSTQPRGWSPAKVATAGAPEACPCSADRTACRTSASITAGSVITTRNGSTEGKEWGLVYQLSPQGHSSALARPGKLRQMFGLRELCSLENPYGVSTPNSTLGPAALSCACHGSLNFWSVTTVCTSPRPHNRDKLARPNLLLSAITTVLSAVAII